MEMENYLKQLCTRLAADYPPQLRHFLRPNSSSSKKADTVAPRLDRFLAKTVSGVFNTLKTVVPGFEMDSEIDVMPMPTLMSLADVPWRFVENLKSVSFEYLTNIIDQTQRLILTTLLPISAEFAKRIATVGRRTDRLLLRRYGLRSGRVCGR